MHSRHPLDKLAPQENKKKIDNIQQANANKLSNFANFILTHVATSLFFNLKLAYNHRQLQATQATEGATKRTKTNTSHANHLLSIN